MPVLPNKEKTGAKKGKKHRKWGRNKKDSAQQQIRTERNKVRRLNKERKKAGLPPVGPAIARNMLNAHTIRS